MAANLISTARRHATAQLASVLQGVAESVAEDVASRRRVEAGRAKPRGSARLVTAFSLVVLLILAFTGDYIAPYRTPVGQIVLVFLLVAYAAGLLWMRKMAEGKPCRVSLARPLERVRDDGAALALAFGALIGLGVAVLALRALVPPSPTCATC